MALTILGLFFCACIIASGSFLLGAIWKTLQDQMKEQME